MDPELFLMAYRQDERAHERDAEHARAARACPGCLVRRRARPVAPGLRAAWSRVSALADRGRPSDSAGACCPA